MRLTWLYLTFLLITGSLAAQTPPLIGVAREEVIELFGPPTNQLRGGTREVLVYPTGRVMLENGRVTSVTVPMPASMETYHPWSLAPGAKTNEVFLTPKVRAAAAPKPMAESNSSADSVLAELSHFAEARWALMAGTIGALVVLFAAYRWGKRSGQSANRPRPSNHTSPMLQRMEPVKTRTPMKTRAPIKTRPPMLAKPPEIPAIPGVETKLPGTKLQALPVQLTERLLNKLEWRRLEMMIFRYYEQAGQTALRKHVSLEATLDVDIFDRGAEKPIMRVRCKGWQVDKLGTRFVREFAEDLVKDGILRGQFIGTTDFTSEARALGELGDIELVSGAEMVKRIKALNGEAVRDLTDAVTAGDYRTPTCVRCNVKMILGTDGEKPTWGCRNSPVCTVTLPVRAGID